jgi:hypoxanthine phosphoribosyltransferase
MTTADQTKGIIQVKDLKFEPFLTEDQISGAVRDLGEAITSEYAGKNPIFIAILNGSYVFVADLLRSCDIACELSFVKLSSYDGLESSGKIETKIGLTQDLKDRHVVILEDIIDTGRTVHHFLKDVTAMGPASVRLAVLLVKPEALEYPLDIDYVGFEIPNKFVVGYGLDYDEAGRNLSAIYQLAEDKG